MSQNPQFIVHNPADWSGTAYITESREDAFACWRENTSQHVMMVEFDGRSMTGKAFDMQSDFQDMLAEERREARAWARHEQSYARAS